VNNDWLDIAVLEDYLDGKLDSKTMNRVEREALEDPFVAQALAGLSASPKRSLASISLLQKQLQDRIAQQQTSKKASIITWQRLSIAATAAVMFITGGIVFWMKQVNYQQMAAKQPKKVEVMIAPLPFDTTSESTPVVSSTTSSTDLAIVKKAKLKANIPAAAASIKLDSVSIAMAKVVDTSRNNNQALAARYSRASGIPDSQGNVNLTVQAVNSSIHPINGWDHLYMYLAANNKFKDKPRIGKSVTLSFLVDTAGKPDQIKVLEGISKAYDKEAIRLLSNGPKWEQPQIDGTRATFKIDF
jgi:hypothetical protein